MGWFSNSFTKVMKAAQKRHAVPLRKAQKIDEQLRTALMTMQKQHRDHANSEGAQLQAATRYFYDRSAVVKQIERDLVSMAEDVAVEEKVVNQLMRVNHFAKSTWVLMQKDWAATVRDFKQARRKWDITVQASKQKKYIDDQEIALKELIRSLTAVQAAESRGGTFGFPQPAHTKRRQDMAANQVEQDRILEEARGLLAKILAARAATKIDSKLGVELYDFWKDASAKLDRYEQPAISVLNDEKHKKEIAQMDKLIVEEVKAVMMALTALHQDLELFEGMGVEVIARARKNKIRQAINQLSMSY